MSLAAAQARWRELQSQVETANRDYHVFDNPLITDAEYDALLQELRSLEQQHPHLAKGSVTQQVGAAPLVDLKLVTHRHPMLSLENALTVDALLQWWKRVGQPELTGEMKYDGLAVALSYLDGQLIEAATRGDGTVGESVLGQVRTIADIPHTIPLKSRVEVRGEVYMRRSVLQAYNERALANQQKPLMNPRNGAAGSLRQSDPEITRLRQLNFFPYDLIYTPAPLDDMELVEQNDAKITRLTSLGFPAPLLITGIDSEAALLAATETIRLQRETLDFDIDGIVFKINHVKDRRKLTGGSSRAPLWAIAFKFPAVEKATKLLDIIVQTGRTGNVTPVAVLEPVEVGGVMVSRATLHNADRIKQLDLHVGDLITVRRAGDVIPEIIHARRTEASSQTPWQFPSHCECGQGLVRLPGEAAFKCLAGFLCEAQRIGALLLAVSRDALDIDGIGDKIAAQLVTGGYVTRLADLFELTNGDWAAILETEEDGLARKVYQQVQHAVTRCSPDRLITALGVPMLGKTRSRLIAERFVTAEELLHATLLEFMAIDGVGPEVAARAYEYFQKVENQANFQRLLELGFAYNREIVIRDRPKLRFAITGSFDTPRHELVRQLQDAGHEEGSLSAKTQYLLAGENAGSKLAKAEQLGVTVIDLTTFHQLLDGKPS